MDAREEMRRWITTVTQQPSYENGQAIKQDIDLLLSAASALSGQMVQGSTQSQERGAKQMPQQKSKQAALRSAPRKAPQSPRSQKRMTKTAKPKQATQARPAGLQTQKNFVPRVVNPSLPLPTQKRQALSYVYGRDTDERRFQQAAKALVS